MTSARPDHGYPEIAWAGWGDPADAAPLSDALRDLLGQALGVRREGTPVPPVGELRAPASTLPAAVREALVAAVGADHVHEDDEARLRHTRGRSTPDLLRLREGQVEDAPDAVVLPTTHDEVLAVLAACAEARVAVVPFGGGTSVVGGLEPEREGFAAVVALDLRRMDRLVDVDPVSRTATLEPGLRGPDAEALVAAHGFTIGHHPQSFLWATIGGFAAARSSGQASAGYGRFDEMVVGLRVATPTGTLELGRAPKSAAGPDLRQLVLGSEGAFGVITQVTVAVQPLPEERVYDGWRFPSFAEGTAALRRLTQDGPRPTVLRLSDEVETALNLARPDAIASGDAPGGVLAIVGFEGTAAVVAERRAAATAVLRELGGEPDAEAGPAWEHGRYKGPYLRDALLDAGALVETLETTTFWSNLPALYAAVGDALRDALTGQGTPPVVLTHVSHVYPTGASLYFTVACAQIDDPLAQWQRAKRAANDAIVAAGGSISHHHGVGVDHREHLAEEIGPLGVALLRAAKDAVDPQGILNPGVLVAPRR
ncbi:FAD-binding oxidoreductase [Patulibacter defluvii]|uniref:FAD-binding oxidoreductase n=1 Tax=Patulibacter defluvii TaxID=3095358 RepID=UPI002A75CA21|nr:FAD-binding oxidoreductase [Patulibacter sp. DM4]